MSVLFPHPQKTKKFYLTFRIIFSNLDIGRIIMEPSPPRAHDLICDVITFWIYSSEVCSCEMPDKLLRPVSRQTFCVTNNLGEPVL